MYIYIYFNVYISILYYVYIYNIYISNVYIYIDNILYIYIYINNVYIFKIIHIQMCLDETSSFLAASVV